MLWWTLCLLRIWCSTYYLLYVRFMFPHIIMWTLYGSKVWDGVVCEVKDFMCVEMELFVRWAYLCMVSVYYVDCVDCMWIILWLNIFMRMSCGVVREVGVPLQTIRLFVSNCICIQTTYTHTIRYLVLVSCWLILGCFLKAKHMLWTFVSTLNQTTYERQEITTATFHTNNSQTKNLWVNIPKSLR